MKFASIIYVVSSCTALTLEIAQRESLIYIQYNNIQIKSNINLSQIYIFSNNFINANNLFAFFLSNTVFLAFI